MTETTLSYIATDFSGAEETLLEYRRRTRPAARRHRTRRAYRRLVVA